MPRFADLDQVKNEVENHGNVLTVTMGELRDAYGAGKLGANVVENIRKSLAGLGIAVSPDPEAEQAQKVRLYKLGTPVADLITAVTTPGPVEDDVIRRQIDEAAEELLKRVREIVCDI